MDVDHSHPSISLLFVHGSYDARGPRRDAFDDCTLDTQPRKFGKGIALGTRQIHPTLWQVARLVLLCILILPSSVLCDAFFQHVMDT